MNYTVIKCLKHKSRLKSQTDYDNKQIMQEEQESHSVLMDAFIM